MKNWISSEKNIFVSIVTFFFFLLLFYFKFSHVMIEDKVVKTIYASYFFLAVIFFITLIIKQSAKKTPTQAKTFVAKILGTLMLKIVALVLMIVAIYYFQSQEVLRAVRFYLLGFFLFFSLLESVVLSVALSKRIDK